MKAGNGRIQELNARLKELQSMIQAKDAGMQEFGKRCRA